MNSSVTLKWCSPSTRLQDGPECEARTSMGPDCSESDRNYLVHSGLVRPPAPQVGCVPLNASHLSLSLILRVLVRNSVQLGGELGVLLLQLLDLVVLLLLLEFPA